MKTEYSKEFKQTVREEKRQKFLSEAYEIYQEAKPLLPLAAAILAFTAIAIVGAVLAGIGQAKWEF